MTIQPFQFETTVEQHAEIDRIVEANGGDRDEFFFRVEGINTDGTTTLVLYRLGSGEVRDGEHRFTVTVPSLHGLNKNYLYQAFWHLPQP